MVVESEANQIDSSVRKWDRAVGLCFKEGVVLAAHRLENFNVTSGGQDTLVFAMTGDPVPADKARRALIGTINELVEEGSPMSAVKKAAKFLPNFNNQTNHKDEIELLAVGRDWDELRREFVPCLSFANTSVSFNPDAYAAGSGSMSSHTALDMLYEKNMSLEEATDLALRAIYDAAFSHTVEGQAVEAVDGDVSLVRHDVKDLHAKYGPLLNEREEYLLRNPVPRYFVSDCKDED